MARPPISFSGRGSMGMIIFEHGYSNNVDGTGTRLIFYLKGCNFNCDWCGAPESISPQCEQMHYPSRIVTVGQIIDPEMILDKARRCCSMIDGVTFGGGEPTLQTPELIKALQLLQNESIHTALESNASTAAYCEVIKHVDQLFSDLKTLSEEKFADRINPNINLMHKVCENLHHAALTHPNLTIRIPVVTQLNDTEDEQLKIAEFLHSLQFAGGKFKVELLRQHHLAEPKYRALGKEYMCSNVQVPENATLTAFAEILKKYNIQVV